MKSFTIFAEKIRQDRTVIDYEIQQFYNYNEILRIINK